jgi:hypothetical protein
MSRFWAADNASSSSESSSDANSSSSEEEVGRTNNANKWEELSDESSDEDVGREVKSAKAKAFDGLKKHVSAIRGSVKTDDWLRIQTGTYQYIYCNGIGMHIDSATRPVTLKSLRDSQSANCQKMLLIYALLAFSLVMMCSRV